MKSLEYVINTYVSTCIDGRDVVRLGAFVPEEDLKRLALTANSESNDPHTPLNWTRDNILEQLRRDVEFGFQKALDQRGISSDAMHSCVMMWNDILEEGLEGVGEYAQYGLPLFKATAVKYGWPNPIGDDSGAEDKYAAGF